MNPPLKTLRLKLVLFSVFLSLGVLSQNLTIDENNYPTTHWEHGGILENENPESEQKVYRTEMSKVFSDGDTSYLYFGEWHYEAKDGTYQDINLILQVSDKISYDYENLTNRFQSFFGVKAIRVSKSGKELNFHQNPTLTINGKVEQGDNIKPVAKEKEIRYPNQFKNVDYQYQLGVNRIQHLTQFNSSVVFSGATGNILSSEEVEIPSGYNLQEENGHRITTGVISGNISVTNGIDIFCTFLQPRVWDQSFNKDPLEISDTTQSSNAILLKYKIESLGGERYKISTLLPSSWATASNRVFPIIIDPYVYFSTSILQSTNYQYPWRADYRQKINQTLIRSSYLSSITSSYEITDLAFYQQSNHTRTNTGVAIEMGTTSFTTNTNDSFFGSLTDCGSPTSLDYRSTGSGWKNLSLSNPYNYTYSSSSNLIISAKFLNSSSNYSSTSTGGFRSYETNLTSYLPSVRGYCNCTGSIPSSTRFYGDEFPYLRITYATITSCAAPSNTHENYVNTIDAQIDWNTVVGRTNYQIYYKPTSSSTWLIGTNTASVLTLNGLSSGTTYEWKVRTNCSGTYSSFTTARTFTTTSSCGIPTNTHENYINSTDAQVDWSGVSGRTNYQVYYKPILSSTWLSGTTTSSRLTLNGLTSGVTYEWKVRTNCSGTYSSFTSPRQFTTTISCGVPPSPVTTSTGTTTANLDWSSVSSYSSFEIQYKPTTSGTWITMTSSWSGINLSGLSSGTVYDWRVRTNCSGTYSSYTSVNQFTTGSFCTVPVASIGASLSNLTIDQGQNISFTDQSSNTPTSWTWTFGRSSTSSRTTQNASNITFNSPGRGWAKLQVSNACGNDEASVAITINTTGNNDQGEDQARGDGTNASAGDPINMSTGEFTWSQKDISTMGIGGEYNIIRNYFSRSGYNNTFGNNWTHNYDITLDTLGDRWNVHFGNGGVSTFVSYLDGSTQPLYRGVLDTMYYGSGGTFVLEKKSGVKYIFTSARLLQKITDRKGNEINFTNNGSSQNTRITFPGGRYVNFVYTSGKVSSISDNAGRTISYLYDSNNDLVRSINVFGDSTSYEYDANHQITKVKDPNRNTVIENVYDVTNRVVEQTDVYGEITDIAYNTPIAGATKITDSEGNDQIFHHTNYRLTKKEDELNNAVISEYNTNNQTTLSINENGDSIKLSFDTKGNLYQVIDALNNTTQIEFDSLSLPTKVTNAKGIATDMVYDSVGNLLETHYAGGGIAYYTYNSDGQVLTYTDPLGRITSLAYSSSNGDLATITTPSGTFSFDYDNVGRVDEIFDRNNKKTTLEYDVYGNIIKITDPKLYTIENVYDKHGNLISFKDKAGTVTTYSYDLKDRLVSLKNALGDSSKLDYNSIDQVIKTIDYNGNEVDFSYTKRGQLSTVTDALGKDSMVYDNRGNLIKTIDALGNTTVNEFDKLNRVIKTTDPLSAVYEQQYNEIGQIIKTIDPNTNATNYQFDSLGLLTKVTDALGGSMEYNRNIIGLITSMTDAENHTIQWQYDSSNRPIKMYYPNGDSTFTTYDNEGNVLTQTDANGIITTATLNNNYEVTQLAYSNGNSYSFNVNKIGAITAMTNSAGTTSIEYDTLHRPISVTDPFGNVIGYGYDANGNRTTTVYPSGDSVTTTYNAVNLPVTVTDWLGNSSTRQYEANGWLKQIANSNGTKAIMERNGLGRFTSYVNLSGADTINRHFLTYDNVGNILANQQKVPVLPDFQSLNINNTYNANDIQQTNGTISYSADKNGALTGKNDGTNSFAFHWIENDLLDYYTTNGDTTRNSYNPFGNRISKTVSGDQIKYVLDIVSGLSQVLQETNASNQIIRSYVYGPDGLGWMVDSSGKTSFYHFDHLGNTVALSDTAGNVTDSFACDPFGALVNHLGNIDQPFVFGGKYGIQYEGAGMYQVRARYYDAGNGRFISRDAYPASLGNTQSINRYVYGLNNPNSWMDPSGLKEQSIVLTGANGSSVTVFNNDLNANIDISSLGIDFGGSYTLNGNDVLQATLDIVGIFDPTGIADGINATLYLKNGKIGAAIVSGLALVPYVGDLAKTGRIGKQIKIIKNAVKAFTIGKKGSRVVRSLDNLSSLRGAKWDDIKKLIPDNWIQSPLKKGEGIKFVNPNVRGEQILLERGTKNSRDLLHQGPYIKVSKNGNVTRIPLYGNPSL